MTKVLYTVQDHEVYISQSSTYFHHLNRWINLKEQKANKQIEKEV